MYSLEYIPFSSIAEVNPETSIKHLTNDMLVSFIPMSDVTASGQWIHCQERRTEDVLGHGYTLFQEGDVLFAKITPCMENGKGTHAIGLVNGSGFGTTEFHVLRAKANGNSRFIYHWLQSDTLRLKAERLMTGSAGQQRVNPDFFDLYHIPFFPPSGQQIIANILDTLDTQIQQTETLIAKLKQVKIALLHDLLTRGIDENGDVRDPVAHPGEFKESRVGKIPQEWEILQIKETGTVQLGRQRSPRYQTGKNTTPYLRVANVFDGWIDYSDVLQMDFTPEERALYYLIPGDILLNEGQSLELVGRSAIYRELPNTHCFQNTLIRFCCNSRTIPEYCQAVFKYWLDTGKFTTIAKQTTSMAHLGASRFAQMSLFVPSPDEQYRIAAVLNAHDSRITTEKTLLTKLKQLKKGLMDDLLTGRVRVTELITHAR